MRHMLGNLSPNYFERTKRYMMLRASRQGTDLTVSGTPPLSLPNSLGKPLKAWSVDLLPYQEGTGDPAPDNVRPIHGTDKVTITTAGKNLLTPIDVTRTLYTCTIEANATEQTIKVTGTATGSGGRLIRLTEIITLPAGRYYISTYGQRSASLAVSNADTTASIAAANSSFNLTKTTRVFCGVNVSQGVTYDDSFTIMMSVGSTAPSDFTPYLAPSQTVITLPQTVYTGTIGSEGGESRWGEVDLGTLTWTRTSTAVEGKYRFQSQLPNVVYNTLNALCEKYVRVQTTYSTAYTGYAVSANNIFIYDDAHATDDVATFTASLSGVKMIYELATPTTFSVPSVTIPTPTGTATTWATAEDGTVDSMSVTYIGKASS